MDKVTNPEIALKIKNLIDNPQVDERTKQGFLTSILEQFNKKGFLSNNQNIALERIVSNYSFDNIEWKRNFLESDKKNNFKIVVDYYRKTGYYPNIIAKVTKDGGYIPTPNEYTAICENKYAILLIKGVTSPAKYNLGDMIRLRPQYLNRFAVSGIGTVIEVTNKVFSACNGNKVYRIYFVDGAKTIECEERMIALARQKDYDSIAERNANEIAF